MGFDAFQHQTGQRASKGKGSSSLTSTQPFSSWPSTPEDLPSTKPRLGMEDLNGGSDQMRLCTLLSTVQCQGWGATADDTVGSWL